MHSNLYVFVIVVNDSIIFLNKRSFIETGCIHTNLYETGSTLISENKIFEYTY